MTVYFEITSFQKFQKGPPAKRAVSAPVIDMKKKIPRTGITSKSCHKNRGLIKQYSRFLQSQNCMFFVFISLRNTWPVREIFHLAAKNRFSRKELENLRHLVWRLYKKRN